MNEVEACYVMFHSREEYDALADYLDGLGFMWASNHRLQEWIPGNTTRNCLHIDPGKTPKYVYQTCYIPSSEEQASVYDLPFLTVEEFFEGCVKFNDSISFEEVLNT